MAVYIFQFCGIFITYHHFESQPEKDLQGLLENLYAIPIGRHLRNSITSSKKASISALKHSINISTKLFVFSTLCTARAGKSSGFIAYKNYILFFGNLILIKYL